MLGVVEGRERGYLGGMTEPDKQDQPSSLISLTGLWKNTTKDGREYWSGSLGMAKLLVFPNRKKEEGSNQPDFNLVLGERPPRAESSSSPPASEESASSSPSNERTADVPF